MLNYKRYFLSVFLFIGLLFVSSSSNATHNRAGEITYKWIGTYDPINGYTWTYEICIITYTKTSSTAADRPSLDSVYLGDGSPPVVFQRSLKEDLGNDISRNTYKYIYTYSGNGTFLIHFEDPNRNSGVVNIPGSVEVPFYVSTLLTVSQFVGANSSPVLTYPPIDRGCVDRVFIHNANAFDPDGDSLSYELTVCRGLNGDPIPGYSYPVTSNSFSIDAITGDLVWNTPITISGFAPWEYNVAFKIYEWRNGVNIGYVTRDMQIIIGNCTNNPPVIQPLNDTCVVAGDTLRFEVTAIDPDGNRVDLSGNGGPFELPDSARMIPVVTNNDTVVSEFFWPTNCSHIRTQPYYAQFRAEDILPADSITLVSLSGVFIRVIGPAPQNPTAIANGNAIQLAWDPPSCSGVVSYKVYRRSGMYPGTIACPCDNGAPSYSGYSLLATTTDPNYLDDDHGNGLSIGVEYCYIITAVYPGGSESCATEQVCASLKKDLPVITNVDVRETNVSQGSIYVAWSKPEELDTILFPGPYQYRLHHSTGFFGTALSQIAVMNDLNDTTYIDTLINTQNNAWSYRVELYYTNNGNLTLKGSSTVASSVFLSIAPSDNRMILSWEEHVPWTNYSYDIFKLNDVTAQYDSITTTTFKTFTDTGLANGVTYCYFIRSVGEYSFPGFIDPIVNRSQRACGVPIDNIVPCSPDLSVQSFCLDDLNKLTWTNPNNFCADDVLKYYIYFASTKDGNYERIDSILSPTDTIYFHTDLSSLAGCYKVTAIDSVGNETLVPEQVCVDTCRQYVLPSVFTPNGDKRNDLFHPCDETTAQALQEKNCPAYKNVKDIAIKIYNRWGTLVFETTDKDINWDGREQKSGKECPEGVYYYTCIVNFYRVGGVEPFELKGYVHLLRSK